MCVCGVWVWVWVCVHAHICAERIRVKARGQLQVIIPSSITFLPWARSLIGLQFTNQWRLAGQWAPGTFLPLPSQRWETCTRHHVSCSFLWVLGLKMNELSLWTDHISYLTWNISTADMKANKIWRWKQHLLTTSQQYPHAYQKTFRTFKGQMNSSNPWKTVIKLRVYIGSLWVFIYKPMFLEVRGQFTSYPFSAPSSEHFISNTSANLM